MAGDQGLLYFGDNCCVLQLVCLLQFGYAPRHPQHQDTKYINHGWDLETGVFRTLTYNQTEDEDEDDEVILIND